MSDHDDDRDWTDLHDLARAGEQYATPLPVERVHELGNRRRTRRGAAMVVTAVVAVAVLGGALLNTGALRSDQSPDPALSPPVVTASPTPARTVGAANLLAAEDIPTQGNERYAESAATGDRLGERVTVCVPPGGYAALGPGVQVSRSFRLDRRYDGSKNPGQPPIGTDPVVLTQVIQFGSAAEATAAYRTYRGWLASCRATITRGNGSPVGKADRTWYAVKTVADARSGFSETVWRPDSGPSDGAYFESVGLVQVDDRMAIMVSLVWGTDYNVAYQVNDDTGLLLHPQFGLLVGAAHGLLR